MSTQLPGAACDCHFHVIGPHERYAFQKDRSYTPEVAPFAAYKQTVASLGVERGVVVQPSVYGLDNTCLCDTLRQLGPTRYRGVAVVDHSVTREQLKGLHELGVRAVRFNLRLKGAVPVNQVKDVARLIDELGWHLEINQNGEDIHHLPDLMAGMPSGMNVVLDHMAHISGRDDEPLGAQFQALSRLLDSGRVWTKLTGLKLSQVGPENADLETIVRRLIEQHPERCIWGSDWPHVVRSGAMPDDERLLQLLLDWTPNAEARRKIFSSNAAALYGF